MPVVLTILCVILLVLLGFTWYAWCKVKSAVTLVKEGMAIIREGSITIPHHQPIKVVHR